MPALILLTLAACQSRSGDRKKENIAPPTYKETIALVFADSSNVTEWHNSPIAQDAINEATLSEGEASGSCGKKIMLTNAGSQDAKITISTVFPFEESPWEISTEYVVAAGATIHAGTNKICHGGKETPFVFKIEGATYTLDD